VAVYRDKAGEMILDCGFQIPNFRFGLGQGL
jgi:hypothetical protein